MFLFLFSFLMSFQCNFQILCVNLLKNVLKIIIMKNNTKTQARETLDFIGRMKVYFLRGHNSWFYFIFYFVNFTLIFYNLLIEKLYFIPSWFSFWKFALLFFFLYPPIAITVGRFDYRKGTYKGEQQVQQAVNPLWRENFERLTALEENLKEIKKELITIKSKKSKK